MPSAGETIFGYCVDALEAIPPLPDALPPEAARIRADKMEVMLRKVVVCKEASVGVRAWGDAIAEARKLLEEE